MTSKFCLCGCGQILTGKQRKFASNACRMRYNRKTKANASRSLLFANRSQIEPRQVKIELSVIIVFGVNYGETFDKMLLNGPTRAKLRQFIAAFLADRYQDCQILAIQVEKKGD